MKINPLLHLLCGALLAVMTLSPGLSEPVYAANVTVNTLDDENDHSCTDGDCSLRDALQVANAGDTIVLSGGGTLTLALGQLTVAKNLTLSGPGAGSLTISGNNASRVLWINSGVTAALSGVTIAHGKITGVPEARQYGAGIHNEGTLTVTNCTFSDNIIRYVAFGGAISNSGTLTVDNSTFSGNIVEAYGGIVGPGGAIFNDVAATLTVNDSSFSANIADSGGAIENRGTLNVSRSHFADNRAFMYGGAIDNKSQATANVETSTFSANSAYEKGGGIFNWSSGTLTVSDSTFAGNTSTAVGAYYYGGGGIGNSGSATVQNSTFTDNGAAERGGGIYNGGGLTLTHCTFSGNHADRVDGPGGGNIYDGAPPTVKNTILANATAGGNCAYAMADGGGNLRWPDSDTSCVGAFGDPRLGALQDNGGPTETMALGADSAALESSVAANCPATDQRAQPRPDPAGTVCDVGAYESAFRPPLVENTDPHVQYNGWEAEIDASASGGSYRESRTTNDTATFKFSGTRVTWIARRGPDMGKAQVLIDGVDKGTLDLYRSTEQWQFKKSYRDLSNAKHTLVVRVTGTRNAKSTDKTVGVDGFQVGAKLTDDTALTVQYNSWIGKANPAANGGSYHLSKKRNARARLTFTGTRVDWITARGPAYGKAEVYLDGVKKGSYDLYASGQQWKAAISFAGLSAGGHTIEIKVLGQKNAASSGKTVIVDGFRGPVTLP